MDVSGVQMVKTMNLLYNNSYNLHCQLTLNSGRIITLKSLNQEMTYAGLVLGIPNAEVNTMLIQEGIRRAQVASGGALQLIDPHRRNYFRTPGDMSQRVSQNWTPEWLPMITCVGSFKSIGQLRDPKMDISVLTVIWYQDEYAPPILDPALSQLLALDWDSMAKEVRLD